MPVGLSLPIGDRVWGPKEIAQFMTERLEDSHYVLVYTGPGEKPANTGNSRTN